MKSNKIPFLVLERVILLANYNIVLGSRIFKHFNDKKSNQSSRTIIHILFLNFTSIRLRALSAMCQTLLYCNCRLKSYWLDIRMKKLINHKPIRTHFSKEIAVISRKGLRGSNSRSIFFKYWIIVHELRSINVNLSVDTAIQYGMIVLYVA